jgi:alpha,alpha-trehalose phosphorylase
MDLHDVEHNARDGLHVASLAGCWTAFVMGFGGLRDDGDVLSFWPRLPDGVTRLAFSILHRQHGLRVEVTPSEARYSVTRGAGPLRVAHYGEQVDVTSAQSVVRSIPRSEPRTPPSQPPGRAPIQRSPG